jgi:uncharacterized damage-inducible protein DinB
MSEEDLSLAARRVLALAERETGTTLKVLQAFPAEHAELRPHEKCKTARELAWLFTMEQTLAILAIRDELDITKGMAMPPAPETFAEVVAAFEKGRAEFLDVMRSAPPEALTGTVTFMTAPHTLGEVPKLDFLEFLVHDQIHHRGQFSIYLRMADGKVPSIYGPTADEPWM